MYVLENRKIVLEIAKTTKIKVDLNSSKIISKLKEKEETVNNSQDKIRVVFCIIRYREITREIEPVK